MQNYGAKIIEALAPFYLEANVGIAPTPELALLAARRASLLRSSRREEVLTHSQLACPSSGAVQHVQLSADHSPDGRGANRFVADLLIADGTT